MEIRNLQSSDLPAVAKVHKSAFPGRALTLLGEEAIGRYYHWVIDGPNDVTAIGLFSTGQLLGFCFGGVFRDTLGGFLANNRQFLLRHIITHPWLATNALFRERIILALRVMWNNLRFSSPPAKPTSRQTQKSGKRDFRILAIAVDPKHQGNGAGKQLILHCETIARGSNYPSMGLSVDTDNAGAIGFYEHLDWYKELASDGTWNGKMRKTLKAIPPEE